MGRPRNYVRMYCPFCNRNTKHDKIWVYRCHWCKKQEAGDDEG